jgi:gliding motility-associated-like protein
MRLKKSFLFLSFLLLTNVVFSQGTQRIKYKQVASSTDNPNQADMDSVREWVLDTLHFGGGMIDTNSIKFVGNPKQFCYFWNGKNNWSELGWNVGLGLSTGDLSALSTSTNTVGYADDVDFHGRADTSLWSMYKKVFSSPLVNDPLENREMSQYTGDAAYIEFIYQPYDTLITIEYIFASDEYPYPESPNYDANITDPTSWSKGNMCDLFGIFIAGQQTADSLMTPETNVPWTSPYPPPNDGTFDLPYCAATVNVNNDNTKSFFHSNPSKSGTMLAHEFDGFTSVSPNGPSRNRELRTLKIEKKVTRCAKKKIKIAIEDFLFVPPAAAGSPPGFFINSTVFLKKGAIKGGKSKPGWRITGKKWTSTYPDFEGKLIEPCENGCTEGCNELLLTFKLDYPPTTDNYPIPFSITNNGKNNIYLYDTTHNNELITVDTLYFGPTETTKTIRFVAHGLSFEQVKNCSFTYAANPCEFDNIFGGTFSGRIDLQLVDNSPIKFDFDPSPGFKQYEAYCKETIDIRIDSTGGNRTTSGGVKPLTYIWPDGPIPPKPVFTYTVNASPDYVPVTVNDRCLNKSNTQVKIVNKPIILQGIQSIFLCGPGQQATVPALTVMPNPADMPGYAINHVVWKRVNPLPEVPLGDQGGNDITVVYDLDVGDAIWTCGYNVTDVCGGEADSTFIVNQSSLVLENIGVCKGDDIVLTTGTPAHWFKWFRKDGASWTQIGTTQTTVDNGYPLGEPQITYKLKIEDNCGELQEAEMTVYVDTYEPAVTYNPKDELCFGENITIEANDSPSSTVSYTWLSGSDIVGTDQTITFGESDYNIPGTYTYTLNTVSETQYFYCTNSTTATYTVHANPSSAFSVEPPEHACTKTDIAFDYNDDVNNKTFIWDFDDSNTDTNPHTVHQYTDPGTYNVRLDIELTYPNPTGHTCSSDSTFILTVDPLPRPNFSANPDEGCEPLFVQFSDQSQDILSGATYSWEFGDGNSDNTTNPAHNYLSYGKYSVKLTVANTDRCVVTESKPDFITVHPNPVADFVADPWIATMDYPVINFIDSTTLVEGGIDSFDWDFGDNNNSSEQNPEHTYGKAGDYQVTLLVITDNSCPDTITKLISITEFVKLYIPSAFAPAGAIPENRKFTIKGTPVDDFHLYIFNRYGQQIWSTHNFENFWDGTDMNGLDVPAGTYIYKIEGTDYKKRNISFKGNVTLIR